MATNDADFKLERTLNFKHAGVVRLGKLTIGGVKFVPDQNQWACRVAIDYLGPEPVWLHAEDELAAFRECLLFASDVILGCTESGWSVRCQEEGDHGALFYFSP